MSAIRAAAEKRKMQEESEELEERNKENALKRKMMDASRGARYKIQNKLTGDAVRDWDGKHKTAQAQNKAIGRALRNEDLDEKIDMSKADMGDVIKDFQQSDAPQFAGKSKEKRREMAIAAKLSADKEQKEETKVKSYKQFVEEIYNNLPELEEEFEEISEEQEQLDEYETKDGRYVHKGSYGSSYQGDDDDDDDKPKKAASTEKRGRGRPKGASSGARQKGSTPKKKSGVEYTGYALRLPGNK
jgi:hypothetical protein